MAPESPRFRAAASSASPLVPSRSLFQAAAVFARRWGVCPWGSVRGGWPLRCFYFNSNSISADSIVENKMKAGAVSKQPPKPPWLPITTIWYATQVPSQGVQVDGGPASCHLFLGPGLKEQLPSSETCYSWSRGQGQETWKRHPVALKPLVWHQKPLDKASRPVRSRCGVPALPQETLTSHLSQGSRIIHPGMVTLWGLKKGVQEKKFFNEITFNFKKF